MAEKQMPDSYEQALAELQIILSDLEQQAVGLDQLTAKTARAKTLLEFCEAKLRGVEQQLNIEES